MCLVPPLPLCHPPSLPHGAGLSGSGLPLTNRIFSDPAIVIVIVIGIVIGVVVIVVVAVVVTGRMSRLRREAGGVGAPFQGVPTFEPSRPVPDELASIPFARAGGRKAVRPVRVVVRSRVVCRCGVVSVVGIVVSVVVIVQVVVLVTVRVSRLKRTVGGVGVPFRRVQTFELPRRVPDKSASISFARAGGGKAV